MIVNILHNEKQVQLRDLTRFDASKTILVKGSVAPITSMKIRAGADSPEIEVFDVDPKKRFLDWAFGQYAFDVDSTNNQLVFEVDGVQFEGVVPELTYSLVNLLAAIKTEMEAIASPFTVSFMVDEKNRITINPSTKLKILPNYSSASLLKHLGFKEDGQLDGYPIEYGLRKVSLISTATSPATIVSDPPVIVETITTDEYVEVYTEDGDALFSQDSDLISEEPDVMKWLKAGRGSYKDLHRKAQREILDFCDRNGYRDMKGKKITKWAFVDKSDVNSWSYYMVLRFFFMGVSNTVGDEFKKKAAEYEKLEIAARQRLVLNLDLNGDGKADKAEGPALSSGRLLLR